MDIHSDEEIWRFVSLFDLSGAIGCNSTSAGVSRMKEIKVFPNPFNEKIVIDAPEGAVQDYRIFDMQGQLVRNGSIGPQAFEIELADLPSSIYFLQTANTFHKLLKTN